MLCGEDSARSRKNFSAKIFRCKSPFSALNLAFMSTAPSVKFIKEFYVDSRRLLNPLKLNVAVQGSKMAVLQKVYLGFSSRVFAHPCRPVHSRALLSKQSVSATLSRSDGPVSDDDARENSTANGVQAAESQSLPLPVEPRPAITRRRTTEAEITPQHFGGALATLVFGAALLSERLNGIGIVQNLELHNEGFHPVLLGSILLLLAASAWPEQRENQNPSVMVRIQMAGARIAYMGLAGAIAAEMYTGKGVLTLLDVETGIETLSDIEAVLAFMVMLILTGPQTRTLK